MSNIAETPKIAERLVSLDVFRGIVMMLLMGEAAQFYDLLVEEPYQSSWVQDLGKQFHHHPWHGLRFWDLIQPCFMFIVGVAMPFSIQKRFERGDTWWSVFFHACRRSAILLALGVSLHIYFRGRLVFEFQNVLSQLSVTYLLTFVLIRRPFWFQLLVSFGLLAVTELLYRLTNIPGYDQPFVAGKNFGTYVDMLISGHADGRGHWVSLNALPTSAHTIWGMMAGQWLRSDATSKQKVIGLFWASIILLNIGYLMDDYTPIIKRIATSSFTVVSGGYALFFLTICYGVVDGWRWRWGSWAVTVVGMNSILIYLFFEFNGDEFFRRVVSPFCRIITPGQAPHRTNMLIALFTWIWMWLLCYFLYRRKIFIRI